MTKKNSLLGVIVLHIVVITGALITMVPIAFMIYASFKKTTEIFTHPAWLPPASWNFDSYVSLIQGWAFEWWYLNSVGYAAIVTVFVLFFCSLAGFAFSKYKFVGKNVLFVILIASTMIPFQLILIPLFIQMADYGWHNSIYSMVVPWVAPALGIFLMRQFILAVPTELIEASRMDGASEFRIYWQIVLPLIRPGILTLGILTFLGSWNSYIWPLLVLRGEKVITLPIGLAQMSSSAAGAKAVPYSEMMAAATLVSIPIIILFLLLQRYFIAGLTIGSVKD
jgi:ABC-type glycerol-3-phosphate transport system permease component